MALRSLYTTERAAENKRKTRFDPLRPEFIRQDEEEADEFEEDIGMSKTGAKRKKVRTDVSSTIFEQDLYQGYDSDSSQEGDARESKKVKNDDDDMFPADAAKEGGEEEEEEEELDARGKPKKKEVKFVDYTEVDGQEISGDEAQDVEDDLESLPSTPGASDDEEIIDAEEVGLAGLKGKHAPKVEKFNLRQEQTEGMFTEEGDFVRKAADPRAHQDTWMEGLTKGQIKRAKEGREMQRQREKETARREAEMEVLPVTVRLERLIRCLQPTETPLKALARLNLRSGKKKKWQPSQSWKKSKMAIDEEQVDSEESAQIKNEIESITAYADNMLAEGNNNIYSTTREKLIVLYQEEAEERFREDPAPKHQTAAKQDKWEYKWPGDDQVRSAFATEDMQIWKEGGFFGDGVLCRRVGNLDEWKSSEDISF
jgi:CD2 antigen cytoplasmic tail-binding protein 2